MRDNKFSMPERVESGRLVLYPMPIRELEEITEQGQRLLPESALSDVVKKAVGDKIWKMKKMPGEVHPWFSYWRMVRREDSQGVGLIGSKGLPDEEGFVELGYAMAREYRNQGYMKEGMTAFLDWLSLCPFCSGARLRILEANLPSVKVAEACGFVPAGKIDIYLLYLYELECV